MARILLGVSGGIAAYKSLELVRLAIGAGHVVRVIQTPAQQALRGRGVLRGPERSAGPDQRVRPPDPARGAYPGELPPADEPLGHLGALRALRRVRDRARHGLTTIAKLAHGLKPR